MSKNNIVIGSYVGTGAAINISVGFVPDHVEVINGTDGDDRWEWYNGITAGHAFYHRSVTDNATTGVASLSRITANGVTAYAGSGTASKGFTVGTALSEAGDTFYYKATRNAD